MSGPSIVEGIATQLLDSTLDGVATFDARFRWSSWNAGMERLVGLSTADVLGHDAFELLPFLIETGEDQAFRRALAGEKVRTRERPYHVPGTGRRGFFEGHYAPLREGGLIVGGIVVMRDITDRKRSEEQLRETETRFQNMADAAPVLLWMSGTDAMCTFFNQTWLTFTGRRLEDEWGIGWAEGVHHEDFQRCVDTYMEAFTQRRVFEMEYRLRRADGVFRWILDRGTPRYTPDGSFAGFIGSCVDITERKQLEADLRKAVQARDEFLSIASHELKTPLTALQLQVDTLVLSLERTTEEARQADNLLRAAREAAAQGARLADLVNVLLDVSRVASGRLELEPEPGDLAKLVAEVVGRWRPAAARVGSAVLLEAPGGPLVGAWDLLRLEQVVSNLLSNAVRYGAGAPIEVAVVDDGRVARLTVRDHGIGIAPGNRARIFDRFERGAAKKAYGGLGLGLWIVRQIVEAMGGTITVDSQPGQGATFTVELPRVSPGSASG